MDVCPFPPTRSVSTSTTPPGPPSGCSMPPPSSLPEELTRDFKTADRSVLDTLAHIYAADRILASPVKGEPPATFIDDSDRNLANPTREMGIASIS